MGNWIIIRRRIARLWSQRRTREVAVAAGLTIAAAAFIAGALLRSSDRPTAHVTARKGAAP